MTKAIALTKKSTRRLVRHQYGWFKLNDERIKWHDVEHEPAAKISSLVRGWIAAVDQ